MRKGVVMIMTLALILALTLAVLRSTTTTEKYLKNMSDTVFYTQLNRTFLDIFAIVKKMTSKVSDASSLKMLLSMPLVVSDEDSGLEGVLRLESDAGKFNINSLIDTNGSINQTFYDYIYATLKDHEVVDSLGFMNLLLDTIDKDSEARTNGSEFTHTSVVKMTDGGIPNKKAFKIIEDFYATNNRDSNIYKVPWDKIITYTGEKVDYNYLTDENKKILEQEHDVKFADNDDNYKVVESADDLDLDDDQKKVFKALKIDYYVPRVACEFEFHYLDRSANINFDYNIIKKGMTKIETIF